MSDPLSSEQKSKVSRASPKVSKLEGDGLLAKTEQRRKFCDEQFQITMARD